MRAGCGAVVALALAMAGGFPVRAHETTVEVTTYFRVEGSTLTALIRLPASILADAGLTAVTPGSGDPRASDGVLRAVALDAAKNFDVMSDDRRLPMQSAKWVASPGSDTSFDSFDAAVAHLAGPSLPPDRDVFWNDAFVDVRLDYPIGANREGLSVRFNGFRTLTGFVQTRATYFPPGDPAREFTIVGPPRHVLLEPRARDAAPLFAVEGARPLIGDRELLLFLLCLAIPQRRLTAALGVFAAFAAGNVLSTIALAARSTAPDVFYQLLFAMTATTALVIAALQTAVPAGVGWVKGVAVCFGLAKGVAAGIALQAALPLAGSHTWLGTTAFLGTSLVAALWLLLIAQPVVQLLYGLRIPALVVTIALAVVPIHAGLHTFVDNGQRLVETRLAFSSRAIGLALDHWPALILAFGFVILLAASLLSRTRAQEPRLT
jgi:hypothetical protein